MTIATPPDTTDEADWIPLSDSAQAVLLEVLRSGPQPRAELAARLGLSVPSLSRITKPLVKSGMLLEQHVVQQNPLGRPSTPLDIDPDAHHFVGIKLTSDGVFAVVTDMRGRVLQAVDDALLSHEVSEVVAQVAAIVREFMLADGRIRTVCSAVGGVTQRRRVVVDGPFLHWRDVPFADLLEGELGLPCYVENDVRALAQAEHWFGDGKGHHSFALVTIGAGIGLGLVVSDRVVGTPTGGIHHQILGGLDEVHECELGHLGCASTMLCSDGLERRAAEALGRPTTVDQLIELARDGQPDAVRVVARSAQALGMLIAQVTNVAEPEVVLISGELASVAELAYDRLTEVFLAARSNSAVNPPILPQTFEFTEWARGAATVAIQMHIVERAPETAPTPSTVR